MYIRKAKNEDDYNEEGAEERQETCHKPQYWVESQKPEPESDNRGKLSLLFLIFPFFHKFLYIFNSIDY